MIKTFPICPVLILFSCKTKNQSYILFCEGFLDDIKTSALSKIDSSIDYESMAIKAFRGEIGWEPRAKSAAIDMRSTYFISDYIQKLYKTHKDVSIIKVDSNPDNRTCLIGFHKLNSVEYILLKISQEKNLSYKISDLYSISRGIWISDYLNLDGSHSLEYPEYDRWYAFNLIHEAILKKNYNSAYELLKTVPNEIRKTKAFMSTELTLRSYTTNSDEFQNFASDYNIRFPSNNYFLAYHRLINSKLTENCPEFLEELSHFERLITDKDIWKIHPICFNNS